MEIPAIGETYGVPCDVYWPERNLFEIWTHLLGFKVFRKLLPFQGTSLFSGVRG